MAERRPPERTPPPGTTAALALADGTIFWGRGIGATGQAVGEVCFNTSMTGYQEIMTDPSYAGQIITFTFPHIGNTGSNPEDIETLMPAARGCVLRADITEPSNWRAAQHFDIWLKAHGLVAIGGIDTRALTRRIRDLGAPQLEPGVTQHDERQLQASHQLALPRAGLHADAHHFDVAGLIGSVEIAEAFGLQRRAMSAGRCVRALARDVHRSGGDG